MTKTPKSGFKTITKLHTFVDFLGFRKTARGYFLFFSRSDRRQSLNNNAIQSSKIYLFLLYQSILFLCPKAGTFPLKMIIEYQKLGHLANL